MATTSLDFSHWQQPWLALSLIALRPMIIFRLLPFFGTSSVPATILNVFVISFALFMGPLLMPQLLQHTYGTGETLFIVIKEIILGATIAFLASMPFWIAENVGFFIDNQRGTTMASVFNPFAGSSTSPFGVLFNIMTTALYFKTGAFLVLLSLMYGSYMIWPLLSALPTFPANFSIFFLDVGDHMLRSSVLYASPMVLAMFMTDFGLGLVNRFAPQLNVFFLSMPIKSAVSMIILILYMSYFLTFIEEEFLDSFQTIKFLQKLIPSDLAT
jgi:type III secretion protein T